MTQRASIKCLLFCRPVGHAKDLPKGSEVITPALTFATTVATIIQADLVPVLIDSEVSSLNVDVNNLSLKEISNIICDIRNLVLPDPKKVPNVGSFFKNSIVKKDEINTTYFTYDDLVLWQLDDQYVKVGSARLIELIKDDINTNSSVFIYKNHSLILITDSSASQADVLKFANTIKQKVFNTFNILLEVEPMVIAS